VVLVIVGAAVGGAAAQAAHAADELLRIPLIVVAVVVGVVIVIAAGGVVWQFRQARLLDGPGVGSRAELPAPQIPAGSASVIGCKHTQTTLRRPAGCSWRGARRRRQPDKIGCTSDERSCARMPAWATWRARN
jgi:hypothetical protein